jgi:hypothetical protein
MDMRELFIVMVLIGILAVLILACGFVVIKSLGDIGDLIHTVSAYKVGILVGQIFIAMGIIWIINSVADETRKHIRLVRS